MMDKKEFNIFLHDIISNDLDEDVDRATLQESINQIYENNDISNEKYKPIIIATFNTMKEASGFLSNVDFEATLMAGEIKTIDGTWEEELRSQGFLEDDRENIVDKYGSEFIQKLQKEDS